MNNLDNKELENNTDKFVFAVTPYKLYILWTGNEFYANSMYYNMMFMKMKALCSFEVGKNKIIKRKWF